MKTKELEKIAQKNGYELSRSERDFILENKYECHYISINSLVKNRLWVSETIWCNDKIFNMIKGSVEFAETPIDDREEIKKYFYKHNSMKTKGGNPTYLAIRQRPSISYPVLQGSSEDIFEYKVEFTDKEIERFTKEYGICLDDFEKNEVEE